MSFLHDLPLVTEGFPVMISSNGTFSALLDLCEKNPPVTGGPPSQRPVTWSFDVFLVYAWTNGWTNNRDNMRRPRADNDVTVMSHIGPLRRKVCPCHDVIRVFLSMAGMSQTNSEIMTWISNYTQTKGWDVNSYMHAHELKWSHSRFLPISRAYTYIHIQLQWLMKS